jgi:hypothetical protein
VVGAEVQIDGDRGLGDVQGAGGVEEVEDGCETGNSGAFRIHPSVSAAVAGVAGQQHAVIGLWQLLELGWSATGAQKRAAVGQLHRLYRGVYALVPAQLLTREGLWLAAVYAAGPGAVLSHRSAAALHGLRPRGGVRIEVTVPTRVRRRQPGIEIHRSTTLTDADVTRVNNIPCTTVARTQFDLAEVIGRPGLERAFDQAEILEVFDLRAIEDQLVRNATRRAAGLVRAVLDEHYVGRTPTWNELEAALLALCRSIGVPDPEVNQWLVLPDGGPPIRPDFMFREQRLVLETDGRQTHRTQQKFEKDRRNDQRLTIAGWRPIRTTWRQVFRRPAELRATLLSLLKGRRSGG